MSRRVRAAACIAGAAVLTAAFGVLMSVGEGEQPPTTLAAQATSDEFAATPATAGLAVAVTLILLGLIGIGAFTRELRHTT